MHIQGYVSKVAKPTYKEMKEGANIYQKRLINYRRSVSTAEHGFGHRIRRKKVYMYIHYRPHTTKFVRFNGNNRDS